MTPRSQPKLEEEDLRQKMEKLREPSMVEAGKPDFSQDIAPKILTRRSSKKHELANIKLTPVEDKDLMQFMKYVVSKTVDLQRRKRSINTVKPRIKDLGPNAIRQQQIIKKEKDSFKEDLENINAVQKEQLENQSEPIVTSNVEKNVYFGAESDKPLPYSWRAMSGDDKELQLREVPTADNSFAEHKQTMQAEEVRDKFEAKASKQRSILESPILSNETEEPSSKEMTKSLIAAASMNTAVKPSKRLNDNKFTSFLRVKHKPSKKTMSQKFGDEFFKNSEIKLDHDSVQKEPEKIRQQTFNSLDYEKWYRYEQLAWNRGFPRDTNKWGKDKLFGQKQNAVNTLNTEAKTVDSPLLSSVNATKEKSDPQTNEISTQPSTGIEDTQKDVILNSEQLEHQNKDADALLSKENVKELEEKNVQAVLNTSTEVIDPESVAHENVNVEQKQVESVLLSPKPIGENVLPATGTKKEPDKSVTEIGAQNVVTSDSKSWQSSLYFKSKREETKEKTELMTPKETKTQENLNLEQKQAESTLLSSKPVEESVLQYTTEIDPQNIVTVDDKKIESLKNDTESTLLTEESKSEGKDEKDRVVNIQATSDTNIEPQKVETFENANLEPEKKVAESTLLSNQNILEAENKKEQTVLQTSTEVKIDTENQVTLDNEPERKAAETSLFTAESKVKEEATSQASIEVDPLTVATESATSEPKNIAKGTLLSVESKTQKADEKDEAVNLQSTIDIDPQNAVKVGSLSSKLDKEAINLKSAADIDTPTLESMNLDPEKKVIEEILSSTKLESDIESKKEEAIRLQSSTDTILNTETVKDTITEPEKKFAENSSFSVESAKVKEDQKDQTVNLKSAIDIDPQNVAKLENIEPVKEATESSFKWLQSSTDTKLDTTPEAEKNILESTILSKDPEIKKEESIRLQTSTSTDADIDESTLKKTTLQTEVAESTILSNTKDEKKEDSILSNIDPQNIVKLDNLEENKAADNAILSTESTEVNVDDQSVATIKHETFESEKEIAKNTLLSTESKKEKEDKTDQAILESSAEFNVDDQSVPTIKTITLEPEKVLLSKESMKEKEDERNQSIDLNIDPQNLVKLENTNLEPETNANEGILLSTESKKEEHVIKEEAVLQSSTELATDNQNVIKNATPEPEKEPSESIVFSKEAKQEKEDEKNISLEPERNVAKNSFIFDEMNVEQNAIPKPDTVTAESVLLSKKADEIKHEEFSPRFTNDMKHMHRVTRFKNETIESESKDVANTLLSKQKTQKHVDFQPTTDVNIHMHRVTTFKHETYDPEKKDIASILLSKQATQDKYSHPITDANVHLHRVTRFKNETISPEAHQPQVTTFEPETKDVASTLLSKKLTQERGDSESSIDASIPAHMHRVTKFKNETVDSETYKPKVMTFEPEMKGIASTLLSKQSRQEKEDAQPTTEANIHMHRVTTFKNETYDPETKDVASTLLTKQSTEVKDEQPTNDAKVLRYFHRVTRFRNETVEPETGDVASTLLSKQSTQEKYEPVADANIPTYLHRVTRFKNETIEPETRNIASTLLSKQSTQGKQHVQNKVDTNIPIHMQRVTQFRNKIREPKIKDIASTLLSRQSTMQRYFAERNTQAQSSTDTNIDTLKAETLKNAILEARSKRIASSLLSKPATNVKEDGVRRGIMDTWLPEQYPPSTKEIVQSYRHRVPSQTLINRQKLSRKRSINSFYKPKTNAEVLSEIARRTMLRMDKTNYPRLSRAKTNAEVLLDKSKTTPVPSFMRRLNVEKEDKVVKAKTSDNTSPPDSKTTGSGIGLATLKSKYDSKEDDVDPDYLFFSAAQVEPQTREEEKVEDKAIKNRLMNKIENETHDEDILKTASNETQSNESEIILSRDARNIQREEVQKRPVNLDAKTDSARPLMPTFEYAYHSYENASEAQPVNEKQIKKKTVIEKQAKETPTAAGDEEISWKLLSIITERAAKLKNKAPFCVDKSPVQASAAKPEETENFERRSTYENPVMQTSELETARVEETNILTSEAEVKDPIGEEAAEVNALREIEQIPVFFELNDAIPEVKQSLLLKNDFEDLEEEARNEQIVELNTNIEDIPVYLEFNSDAISDVKQSLLQTSDFKSDLNDLALQTSAATAAATSRIGEAKHSFIENQHIAAASSETLEESISNQEVPEPVYTTEAKLQETEDVTNELSLNAVSHRIRSLLPSVEDLPGQKLDDKQQLSQEILELLYNNEMPAIADEMSGLSKAKSLVAKTQNHLSGLIGPLPTINADCLPLSMLLKSIRLRHQLEEYNAFTFETNEFAQILAQPEMDDCPKRPNPPEPNVYPDLPRPTAPRPSRSSPKKLKVKCPQIPKEEPKYACPDRPGKKCPDKWMSDCNPTPRPPPCKPQPKVCPKPQSPQSKPICPKQPDTKCPPYPGSKPGGKDYCPKKPPFKCPPYPGSKPGGGVCPKQPDTKCPPYPGQKPSGSPCSKPKLPKCPPDNPQPTKKPGRCKCISTSPESSLSAITPRTVSLRYLPGLVIATNSAKDLQPVDVRDIAVNMQNCDKECQVRDTDLWTPGWLNLKALERTTQDSPKPKDSWFARQLGFVF